MSKNSWIHETAETALLERATAPHSAVPRPFLRWAGSKRLLSSRVLQFLPRNFNRYFEPFLGSGSLFFLLQPTRATLSDTCGPLIQTYLAVRDNPKRTLDYLRPLQPDESTYYHVRSKKSISRYEKAANFIYLNKTCWNGLYRVNSRGEFNVPFGRPKSANITDEANLLACSALLGRSGISIAEGDFAQTVMNAKRGDFVYLDPPYVTGHSNNGFRDYNETLFRWEDQERLAGLAHALRRRGVFVVISNAYHEAILDLYKGFRSARIERKSTLASDTSRRGKAIEVVFFS